MSIFSLRGRIGRLEYFVWMLCLSVLYAVFKNLAINEDDLIGICIIGIGCVILLSTFPVVRRFHDLNTSGWWVVAWCVLALMRIFSYFLIDEVAIVISMVTLPISLALGIVLLFIKGTDGENKYGTRKKKSKDKIGKENNIQLININPISANINPKENIGYKYVGNDNAKRKGHVIVVVISGGISFLLGLIGGAYAIILFLERDVAGFIPFILSFFLIFYIMKTNFGIPRKIGKESLNKNEKITENTVREKQKVQNNLGKVCIYISLVVIMSFIVIIVVMNSKIDRIERRVSNTISWVDNIEDDLNRVRSELDDVKSEVY